MPGIMPEERVWILLIENVIFVNFALGAIPGMEIRGNHFDFTDIDIIGKQGIEPPPQGFGRGSVYEGRLRTGGG